MPGCSFRDRYVKYQTLITGGLADIFWQHVTDTGLRNETNILDDHCVKDLLSVVDNVKHGSKAVYHYIDSSSSSPSGYLEGTASNFGDFDQCMKLERSQYCNMHLYPIEEESNHDDLQVHVTNLTFPGVGMIQTLCLPHTCSIHDIKKLVNKAIECLPIHLIPDLQCDRISDTSFTSKVSDMSNSQKIAVAILTAILMTSALSTYLGATSGLYGCFNLKQVNDDIVMTKGATDMSSVRINKLILIYIGIMAHAVTCLESPRFAAMATKVGKFMSALRNPICQVIVGTEGNISLLGYFRWATLRDGPYELTSSVLSSGLSTFWLLERLHRSGTSRLAFVFQKWFRISPLYVCLPEQQSNLRVHRNIMKTLGYSHFAIYAYVPNYLFGLLLVYLVNMRKFGIQTQGGHLAFWLYSRVGLIVAFSGPVFFGYLNLIPDPWVPLYAVTQRMLNLSCWMSEYVQEDYRNRVKGKSDLKEARHLSLSRDVSKAEPETGSFSLVHAMMRIQYAAYLTNYWVIRMDLFTNTAPVSVAIYPMVRRVLR
ncbi:hypothetical protein HDE_06453 [Halotydeus destructor]|nr:hypothetical protein HDE_06453 [Halotydeus destructor]